MKKQSIQTLLLAVFLMPGVVRGQRVTTLPQLFALAEEQSQSIKSFKTAAEASEHQLSARGVAELRRIFRHRSMEEQRQGQIPLGRTG